MKKKYSKIQKILIIIFFLYPFNCFADYNWKKIITSSSGDVYYFDLNSIKRTGNNVYFLKLRDYLKPDQFGDLSNIIYHEVNCSSMEFKYLKDFYYSLPMGNGEPSSINNKISDWKKARKGSIGETILKFVCKY
tara:strand:- start:127 stop:528 length:402 start_codon:yes stop_codon:yes gene_type:complete